MILVSAGHHPRSRGAHFGDFYEHDEAVIWAQRIVDILGSDSAILVPTGSLPEKLAWIKHHANNSAAAIEIHFNSAQIPHKTGRYELDEDGNEVEIIEYEHIGAGSETLFCPGSFSGHRLATMIQNRICIVSKPDRGTKEGWYQMNPAKGPDVFLSDTSMPAVIVEPEFIHRRDRIVAMREQGCSAIVGGLLDYVQGR